MNSNQKSWPAPVYDQAFFDAMAILDKDDGYDLLKEIDGTGKMFVNRLGQKVTTVRDCTIRMEKARIAWEEARDEVKVLSERSSRWQRMFFCSGWRGVEPGEGELARALMDEHEALGRFSTYLAINAYHVRTR